MTNAPTANIPTFDSLELNATSVSKQFNRREIVHNVSFAVQNGMIFGITGRNGAGKSTLIKILAGVLSPTSGSVQCIENGTVLNDEERPQRIGFVAPYLALYEEFSPLELMRHIMAMRGLSVDEQLSQTLLRRVRLYERRGDEIRGFSSGMKQRMKYAVALLHLPPILMFDEPMSNLDTEGIEVVTGIIREHQSAGGITVVATNDERDIALCDSVYAIQTSEVL